MFSRANYKEDSSWSNIPDTAASVKHDGANYFMVFDRQGSPSFFSRRPSVKGGFPNRTSQLPHLTSKPLPQFANQVINIELIHTGHSSQGKEDHPRLSGILNSLPEKSIKSQEEHGPVRAVMIDVIHPKINTYGEKLEHMKKIEEAFGKPELLKSVSVKIGSKGINDLIDSTRNTGKEGVIITSLTEPETSNTRIKVKHTNTYNLKVKRVNQEYDILGNPKDSAGSLTVVDSSGKEVADVGSGFSKEQRKEIWNNPDNWVGREIQVKGRTPSRNRIIAPVYNGDSDGSLDMIKSASTIEDQLLENLVAKYSKSGKNLQSILDNPLFQQLPLVKKITFIEQAGSPISTAPTWDIKNIVKGTLGGAGLGIGGAVAAVLNSAMKSNIVPKNVGNILGMGVGLGVLAGGGAAVLGSYLNKKRDNDTMNAAKKDGISALIQRSISTATPTTGYTTNKLIGVIESGTSNINPSLTKYYNLPQEV